MRLDKEIKYNTKWFDKGMDKLPFFIKKTLHCVKNIKNFKQINTVLQDPTSTNCMKDMRKHFIKKSVIKKKYECYKNNWKM